MSQAPLYTKTLPDTSRGLNADLWRHSLQDYARNDPAFGIRIKDDFTDHNNAITGTGTPEFVRSWSVDREAGNSDGTVSFLNSSSVDGVGQLNSTSTTNHGGITAQYVPALITTSQHSTDPRGRVVCQIRLDFIDADTIFVGLSEAGDQFLSATSTLPADEDFIGFYSVDGGTNVTFYCRNDNNAGTAVEQTFDVTSYLSGTGYQNVGFAVNKDGSVEVVVNGYWLPGKITGITSAAVPIETLTPRLSATAGGGSTAPTLDIDCIDVYRSESPIA